MDFCALNLASWLLSNFSVAEESTISVSDIVHMYESSRLTDKENRESDKEVGRVARQIFPNITMHKVRVGGKRHWLYKGITARIKNSPLITQISDLNHGYEPGFGFSRGICNDEFSEWTKTLPDKLDSQRVTIEVKIRNSLEVDVIVGGCKLDLTTIGIRNEPTLTHDDLTTIFYALTVSQLCKGFKVNSTEQSLTCKGDIQGKCGQWSKTTSDELNYESRHKSVYCNGMISLGSKSETCKKCWRIKKNCGGRLNHKQAREVTCNPRNPNTVNRKRKSLMSKEELLHELKEEKRKRINTERREDYIREKIKREMIEYVKEDHEDFAAIFQNVPEERVPDDMRVLWAEQAKAVSTAKVTGRRWHPKVIRLCLSIWNRSPQAYKELKESGMLALPSGRLLEYYKNSVPQRPGLSTEMLKWMRQESDRIGLDELGRCGGIVLDEMSIQEDLQMKMEKGESKLVGLVSLGDEHNVMSTICKSSKDAGDKELKLATHVLQFVFVTFGGFRFPFAHWPTEEVDAATLYFKFWDAVGWLRSGGFKTFFCCCDGGESNRSFIKAHFQNKDIIAEKYTTTNPFTGEPLVFYMDPYHNLKKLRNNIEKSDSEHGKRSLQLNSGKIEWESWKMAYKWDQEQFTLKLHEKLTEEHFNLGFANKMRNHLATDVLDRKMLYLMKAFRRYLASKGNNVSDLDKAIELLEMSSTLVEIFSDMKPIQSLEDNRLSSLIRCEKWLNEWKDAVMKLDIDQVSKNKMLLSDKLRFDLTSMSVGLVQLCNILSMKFPGSGIVPGRLNSNVIENVFCHARGKNGQNANPTYAQYGPTMNSILLGQKTTTRRSNSGKMDQLCSYVKKTVLVERRSGNKNTST